ncbi:MAG: 50S ribosomal protein L9 [Acidimicrobiales bacterium]
MELILRSDVATLGKKGDVISVADGYARNYLMPKGLAMKAHKGALEQASAMRRARDVRDAADRQAAEELARQLVPKVINIKARAGAGGKLFGSVTTTDVAQAVLAQTGIELDRRKLYIDETIKEAGTYRVAARLHAEVEFPVTVEVSAS